jgi:BirA family biotin operon repressor/biotin-[acetyl-CoA-carboxylase] ligase
MRYEILSALRSAGEEVSGEVLSRRLGISRVAVWKQIEELRRFGYRVAASPRGYRLESAPDLLLPGEFPGWESRVHHFDAVDSTMRAARTLARGGAEEGTLVVAETQTGGRGRLQRSWFSPSGGIYMTLVTRPRVAPFQAPRLNLLTAVAVSDSLERLHGITAGVKWPNDVLIGGRKVCGILAEMEAECDAVHYVNVGIGLNANSPVRDTQPLGVSLEELLGAPVDRARLARDIVEGVLSRLPRLLDAAVLDEWRRRTVTLGREVSIAAGDVIVRGTAIDIDDSGALLVRHSDGRVLPVVVGDCAHGDAA